MGDRPFLEHCGGTVLELGDMEIGFLFRELGTEHSHKVPHSPVEMF